MARLINVIHGEMRGSIAGNTYSRNKAGMIVRYKAKPTQPNNSGQVQARASFGASAVAFTGLDASDRQSWNQFATQGGGFIPLRKMNEGQFSGVNAFASLRSSLLNATNKLSDVTISPVGSPAVTVDPIEFEFANTAPTAPFVPSIQIGDGGGAGVNINTFMNLVDVSVSAVGTSAVVQIDLNPGGLAGGWAGLIANPGNEETASGFVLYASESMRNPGMRSKNKFAVTLFACKPILFSSSVTTTDLTSFDVNADIIIPTGKTRLVGNQWNDFTLVAINKFGQTSVIGTVNKMVSAT
jgi:hypothetical protein